MPRWPKQKPQEQEYILPFFFLRSTKENEYAHMYFCPLIRKLFEFENLKWAKGGQQRKQRTSNFTHEIQFIFWLLKFNLVYFHMWNIFFFKYTFYLINIFLYFISLYIIKSSLCAPTWGSHGLRNLLTLVAVCWMPVTHSAICFLEIMGPPCASV